MPETSAPPYGRRLKGLQCLVGNTPLLEITVRYHGKEQAIYAKAEHLNLTGSIKDRMALGILQRAAEAGQLHPSTTIVEATSGNTGIAFAALGRALGHPVVIFMPDWMSRERLNLIRSLGAEVRLVSRQEGGFLGAIQRAEELAAATPDAFLPRQFSNDANIAAHEETTGPEIWWQLHFRNLVPDAFVAGVGTGGTLMGVGRCLRAHRPSVRLHPLEPAGSPTLTMGHCVGSHRIQGISDEFIPPIVDLSYADEILAVEDGDAILMARRLAAELGLGVGISSGANLLGAAQVLDAGEGDPVVVTVFPDDNKKYLSTDLLRPEPVQDSFLSPDIELLGYRAFKRVCQTCCDPVECAETMPVDAPCDECMPPCPRRDQAPPMPGL